MGKIKRHKWSYKENKDGSETYTSNYTTKELNKYKVKPPVNLRTKRTSTFWGN